MKKYVSLFSLLTFAVCLSSCVKESLVDDSTAYTPLGTGVPSYVYEQKTDLGPNLTAQLDWKALTSADTSKTYAKPIAANADVVVYSYYSADGFYHLYNQETGVLLGNLSTPDLGIQWKLKNHQFELLTTKTLGFYAPQDGSLLQEIALPQPNCILSYFEHQRKYYGINHVSATESCQLLILDGATINPLFDIEGKLSYIGAIDEETLVFSSRNQKDQIVLFNLSTRELEVFDMPNILDPSKTVLDQGVLYYLNIDGLHALDLRSREALWSYSLLHGNEGSTNLIEMENGQIAVKDAGNWLYVVDMVSGTEAYKVLLPYSKSKDIAYAEGVFYAAQIVGYSLQIFSIEGQDAQHIFTFPDEYSAYPGLLLSPEIEKAFASSEAWVFRVVL